MCLELKYNKLVVNELRREFARNNGTPELNVKAFCDEFHTRKRRLILLDYETLDFSQNASGQELILVHLCANPQNIVYLLTSHSRSSFRQDVLELDNLNFVSEDGIMFRRNSGEVWGW